MQDLVSTKKEGAARPPRPGARRVPGGRATQAQLVVLALPVCLFLLFFNYVPLAGLWIAFTNFKPVKGIFGSAFVGLRNFQFIFTNTEWGRALLNTLFYNVGMIATGTVFAVGFAILLNEIGKRKFVRATQVAFLVPHFVSWVTGSILLYAFLNARLGIVNHVAVALGGAPVNWYSEPGSWPFIIVAANLWKSTGYYCIIFYSALMGIDTELFEQASIDGCSRGQKIRHITIPSLLPAITINSLISLGYILYSDIGMFWVLPLRGLGGPPDQYLTKVTDVIQTFVYRKLVMEASGGGSIGMASAMGLLQSVVGFVLVVLLNRAAKAGSRGEYALF